MSGYTDPWAFMWRAATEAVGSGALDGDGLSPSWVCPGPYRLHRHLPHLPLSAESAEIGPLLRKVARYRLTLGQPDPDHLLEALSDDDALDDALAEELIIDLAPRRE